MSSPRNIAGKEVVLRYFSAVLFTAIAVILLYYFQAQGFPVLYRVFLMGLWYFAALGLLQGRNRVCVYYAQKQVCSLGNGKVPVTDPEMKAALQKASVMISVQAMLISVTLTILSIIL